MSYDEYSHIDTTGTTVTSLSGGKLQITLDKRVTTKAFKQVVTYLYQDRTDWEKDTDKALIQETYDAAKYLGLKRLETICESYLDKSKQVQIPDSTWWKNMKWAFENLREGRYDMSDLTLVCQGDGEERIVKCHAVIVTSSCKYFHSLLLGEVENEEKQTMRIVIPEATEKQMLSILKYIYTREFEVDVNDVISVWLLANKFLLEDLQVECEAMIMKNINESNASDIRKVAEAIDSKRVIEICQEFERNKELK